MSCVVTILYKPIFFEGLVNKATENITKCVYYVESIDPSFSFDWKLDLCERLVMVIR
jgi:hypothetical protein